MKELEEIPGVGKKVAARLWGIGIKKISDLEGKDPQKLYDACSKRAGKKEDRCLLYVFRCAVYYASEKDPKPELLKWWNWQDHPERSRRTRRFF